MKKISLILFIFSGILIFGQTNDLKNFNNNKSFTVDATLSVMTENGEKSYDEAPFKISFTQGHFSLPDYDYSFDIIDFERFTNDGEEMLEINAVYSDSNAKVNLFFSLDESDGVMILNETNTTFYFEYDDKNKESISENIIPQDFLGDFDNKREFVLDVIYGDILEGDKTVVDEEEPGIMEFSPGELGALGFVFDIQEYLHTTNENGSRILGLITTFGANDTEAVIVFNLDENYGAIEIKEGDILIVFYF